MRVLKGLGHARDYVRMQGQLLGIGHMRTFAHIQKWPALVKAQGGKVVLGDQFLCVFPLVGFAHSIDAFQRICNRKLLVLKGEILLDQMLHLFFDFREILFGDGSRKNEVVIKTILDRRAEPEFGAWAQFHHRLSQDVGQAMANA
ncbi:MAG: hypothetical protein EBX39_09960, partial [Actinobacteria bacterium]|nr:hypothetical protein [Actinomycetota bacterium]